MEPGKKLSVGAEMPSILIVSKPLPDGTVEELFVGAATML
jgi:hypothetical protein